MCGCIRSFALFRAENVASTHSRGVLNTSRANIFMTSMFVTFVVWCCAGFAAVTCSHS